MLKDIKTQDMHTRVAYYKDVATRDTGGGTALSMVKLGEFWAIVTNYGGSEHYGGQRIYYNETFSIVGRYRTDIKNNMYIRALNTTTSFRSRAAVKPR